MLFVRACESARVCVCVYSASVVCVRVCVCVCVCRRRRRRRRRWQASTRVLPTTGFVTFGKQECMHSDSVSKSVCTLTV